MWNQRYTHYLNNDPQTTLYKNYNPVIYETLAKAFQKNKNKYTRAIFIDCQELSSEELKKFFEANFFTNIKELHMNKLHGFDDQAIEGLKNSGNINLNTLELPNCGEYSPEALADFFRCKTATNLMVLDFYKSKQATDVLLEGIASSSYMQNLQKLNLAKCSNITDAGLIALGKSDHIKNLKYLNLTGCWKVSDAGIKAIGESDHIDGIKEVHLDLLDQITVESVKSVCFDKCFKKLRVLSMSKCFFIEDDIIVAQISKAKFQFLEELYLNQNARVSNYGIKSLVESECIPRLKKLEIEDLSISLKSDILLSHANFESLEHLSITSDKLEHFLKSLDKSKLKTFRYATGKVFPEHMEIYKPEDVASVNDMKKVMIANDLPPDYSFKFQIFQDIQVLCLCCPEMTDDMFVDLLDHSRDQIRVLKLFDMASLTQKSFFKIFEIEHYIDNLKSFHVKETEALTDDALKIISKNKSCELKELIIEGNKTIMEKKLITNSGIRYLILSPVCSELEHLELTELGLDETVIKYATLSKDMMKLRTFILDKNFNKITKSDAQAQELAFSMLFQPECKLINLETLSLLECKGLNHKAFTAIRENTKTDVIQGASKLESIRLYYSEEMNSSQIIDLFINKYVPNYSFYFELINLHKMDALREIHIEKFFSEELFSFTIIDLSLKDVSWLKDSHLAQLTTTKNLGLLQSLKLAKCPQVTGSFFHDWTVGQLDFRYLRKVTIIDMEQFREDCICEFIQENNLVRLRKLILNNCNLSNRFFQVLSNPQNKYSIRRLRLYNLSLVDDDGLKTFLNSEVAKNLRRLFIDGLPQLTYQTFETIANTTNLQHLVILDIRKCPKMDPSKFLGILRSSNLDGLSILGYDQPLDVTHDLLKSFVNTRNLKLSKFDLDFRGDIPLNTMIEILREPHRHLKQIMVYQMIGEGNVNKVLNDETIKLLIESDFIDICLHTDVSDNKTVSFRSVEKLLNEAMNPEFDLFELIKNYGPKFNMEILTRMKQWKLEDGENSYSAYLHKMRERLGTLDSSAKNPKKKKIQGQMQKYIEEIGADDEKMNTQYQVNFYNALPDDFDFKQNFEELTPDKFVQIIPLVKPGIQIKKFYKANEALFHTECFKKLVDRPEFAKIKEYKFREINNDELLYVLKSKHLPSIQNLFKRQEYHPWDLKQLISKELLESLNKLEELKEIDQFYFGEALDRSCKDVTRDLLYNDKNINVKKIKIENDFLNGKIINEIVGSTALSNLQTLTLRQPRGIEIGECMKLLTQSQKFQKIKNIHFHELDISAEVIDKLVSSPNSRNLEEIFIKKCNIEHPEDLNGLASQIFLTKLRKLKLDTIYIPSSFFVKLAHSTLDLHELVFQDCVMNDNDEDALTQLSFAKFGNLKHLYLDGLEINDDSLISLANSPNFKNLESLYVDDENLFKIKEAKVHVEAKGEKQQQGQDRRKSKGMTENPMPNNASNDTKRSFVKSQTVAPLSKAYFDDEEKEEDFELSPLTNAGVEALAASPNLPNLKKVGIFHKSALNSWLTAFIDCPNPERFEQLEFASDSGIDSRALVTLIKNLDKMKSLNMQRFIETHKHLLDDYLIAKLAQINMLKSISSFKVGMGQSLLPQYLSTSKKARKKKKKKPQITPKGLKDMIKNFNPVKDPFDLKEFLIQMKNIVEDSVVDTLLHGKYISMIKSWNFDVFPMVSKQMKTEVKLRLMDDIESVLGFVSDHPEELTDDSIERLVESDAFQKQLEKVKKNPKDILNIQLNSNIHKQVKAKGLNILIQSMCKHGFTFYHDWILLDKKWISMIKKKTLKMISQTEEDALDLVEDLDFSQNHYLTTNGYQHLMRENIENFQQENRLEEEDPFLKSDSNEFIVSLQNRRYEFKRTLMDDEVGADFINLMRKCLYVRRINLCNKNFGDEFCRDLSIALTQKKSPFLQSIDLNDNPRITSVGLKYIYTAVFDQSALQEVKIRCDQKLERALNTLVEEGLYYYVKQKLKEVRNDLRINATCCAVSFYMLICPLFGLWQCFEDQLMGSVCCRGMKKCLEKLNPFGGEDQEEKDKRVVPVLGMVGLSALPEGEPDNVKVEVIQKTMAISNEIRNKDFKKDNGAQEFFFSKDVINLNEKLKKNYFLITNMFLHFVIFYGFSIFLPIFLIDECNGLPVLAYAYFACYGAFLLIFEVCYLFFMIRTIKKRSALKFQFSQIIPLVSTLTAKFDFFMDVVFIVDSLQCGFSKIGVASIIVLSLNTLFNSYHGLKNLILYVAQTETQHNTSQINSIAKAALSLEFHSMGLNMDRFSTSSTTKAFGVEVPQIMLTAFGKFLLEDFPQFLLQIARVYQERQEGDEDLDSGVILAIISTVFSVILSFNTAMRARPSLCTPEQVEFTVLKNMESHEYGGDKADIFGKSKEEKYKQAKKKGATLRSKIFKLQLGKGKDRQDNDAFENGTLLSKEQEVASIEGSRISSERKLSNFEDEGTPDTKHLGSKHNPQAQEAVLNQSKDPINIDLERPQSKEVLIKAHSGSTHHHRNESTK